MKHFSIYCFIFTSVLLYIILISDAFKAEATESIPERYSLSDPDIDLVSDMGNQGQYNTCWAYSALGSIQTQLKKKGVNRNLSSFYLAYMAYSSGIEHSFPLNVPATLSVSDRSAPFYEGGTSSIAAALITSWRGIVYEDRLADSSFIDENPLTIAEYIRRYNIYNPLKSPEYIVRDIYNLTPWISEKKKYDGEYIKDFIISGNSVSSTCSINPDFFNYDTSSLYNGKEFYHEDGRDKFYHSILIVGWDDNYSKENFISTCRPENNGAWLIKNSYGSEFGIGGYFWISYEDNTLLESVVYSSLDVNNYKKNYQYDYYGWITSLNTATTEARNSKIYTTGSMANVFRADNDEYISAVSICTLDENTEYEITVYSGITDRSDPVSGTPSSVTSGCQKYPGFHIITLNNDVRINEADYFSVVVKIFNPETEFTIPIEAGITAVSDIPGAPPIINVTSMENEIYDNQSFIYIGSKWQSVLIKDLNGYPQQISINPSLHFPYPNSSIRPTNITYGNVCVKAFSTEYTPLPYDANDDGIVNSHDIVFLMQNILSGDDISYGSSNRFSDFDKDGAITSSDLILLTSILLEK